MGKDRYVLIGVLIGSSLLAIVFMVASFGYPAVDGVGSGGVPRLVSGSVLLMSLLALRKPIVEWWGERRNKAGGSRGRRRSWRPVLSVSFFLLYVFSLMVKFPGFLPSTLLLLVVQSLILRKRSGNILVVLGYAIAVTGVTYILFIKLLYLRI